MFILRGFPCQTKLSDLLQLGRDRSDSDRLTKVQTLNTELDTALTKAVPALASKLYLDFNGKLLSKLYTDLVDALRSEAITYRNADLEFLGYLMLSAEKANVLLAHCTCESIFKKSSVKNKDTYLHGIVSSNGDAQIIPTVTVQTVDLSGDPVNLIIYLGEFSAQRTKEQWERFFLLGLRAFTDKTENLDLSYAGGREIYLANNSTIQTNSPPDFWGDNYLALKKWILS